MRRVKWHGTALRATLPAVVPVLLLVASCHPQSVRAPAPDALQPELFGAGLFSTGAWDFFIAESPDARRVLFCRADTSFSTYEILETRRSADGTWLAPTRPRFAAAGSNADPHLTRDGRTVYFISNRPIPGESRVRQTYDVWRASLDGRGEWGEAERLPPPVNVVGVTEWSPSVAANGNLYFGTVRDGGKGDHDLWVLLFVGGEYQEPVNLGDSVNTAGAEIEPWISPDERYLVFSAASRADSIGGYDLYLSVKRDGVWQKARPIPPPVNTAALEFNQSVSPDGRWLYFSSTRPYSGPLGERFDRPASAENVRGIGNGKTGDIYRVPLAAVARALGVRLGQ